MGTVRLGLAPIVVFLPQTFYSKTIGPTVTYVKYGNKNYQISYIPMPIPTNTSLETTYLLCIKN